MTGGRIGVAPCGHKGEAIVGQFYRCIEGCVDDSLPSDGSVVDFVLVETTERLCAACGSSRLTCYPGLAASGQDYYICNTCGHIFVG